MTKKLLQTWGKLMLLIAILLPVGLSTGSCSKDKDDEPTIGNIVGTWVSQEVETSNGLTITTTYTVSFSSNGTGYRKTETRYSTGANSSDMFTFRYTVAQQSDGVLKVTIVDDEDNYSQVWSVTQTGNTLLIGTRIYKRQ